MEKLGYDSIRFSFRLTENELRLADKVLEELACKEVGADIVDVDGWQEECTISIEFTPDYKGSPEKTVDNIMKSIQTQVNAMSGFNIDAYIGRKVEIVGGCLSGTIGILVACPCAIADASKKVLLVNDYDAITVNKEDIPFAKLLD